MKTVIYARVATKEQLHRIDEQTEKLKKYADQKRWTDTNNFIGTFTQLECEQQQPKEVQTI